MKLIIDRAGVTNLHNQENFVVKVFWYLEVETNKKDEKGKLIKISEQGKSVLDYSTQPLSFVKFEDLTKEAVKNWVIQTPEYKEAEKILQNKLLIANAPPLELKSFKF